MTGVSINDATLEQRPPVRFRACLLLSIILCGLALRHFGRGFGLPPGVVKYGGSLLWGTMVFFLTAMIAGSLRRRNIAPIASLIAVTVELSRLVHTPWLDDFRLTAAGALLLGRVFSPWNLLAYGGGIALGAVLDRFGHAAHGLAKPAVHSAS